MNAIVFFVQRAASKAPANKKTKNRLRVWDFCFVFRMPSMPRAGLSPAASDVLSVTSLLRIPPSDTPWIIEGLLKCGSQMLLAGPPKSGKSLLASEIAVALALPFKRGEQRYLFGTSPAPSSPKLRVNPPADAESWKVLFISLEMRPPEVASRLRKQLQGFEVEIPNALEDIDPPHLQFPLFHVFGFNDGEDTRQDLRIADVISTRAAGVVEVAPGKDFQALRDLIGLERPDVVIYDTLIQLHSVNENDNVQMKELMRILRRATVVPKPHGSKSQDVPVAHVVLHHTRKESGHYGGTLSPEMMRGAGSVHAVADVVMLTRRDNRITDGLEVAVSSRSSSIDNFHLQRTRHLTHVFAAPAQREKSSATSRRADIVKSLLVGAGARGRSMSIEDIELAAEQKRVHIGTVNVGSIGRTIQHLLQKKAIVVTSAQDRNRKNRAFHWTDHRFRLAKE